MQTILKECKDGSSCDPENTVKYLLLLFFKLGLDMGVFHFCNQKLYRSFLSIFSLFIILADLLMVFCIATIWFRAAEIALGSLCILLANASATYGALPLPVMCLGLLDYYLDHTWIKQSAFSKILRNVVLTLLVWMLALIYSFGTVKPELGELFYESGINILVCEVEENTVVACVTLGLFIAVLCTILPFWSRIPQWVKEADNLSELSEENLRSDLLFTSTPCIETKYGEKNDLNEPIQPRPPLWLSFTLGFGIFWMPYLTLSTICLVSSIEVPSYITVNLLWLECTNSVLGCVLFCVKSKTQELYSQLPENVCSWHVYWHLSKGTQLQQLPIAVFNPSRGRRNSLLFV
uniref:probable G-protein coupled receptor 160 n=1 Tax=Monopterus albus TaxID=43700 RepID=UPI0009B38FBD|nr:probable G-protein coupled receptor 160 [Monopterus albus]